MIGKRWVLIQTGRPANHRHRPQVFTPSRWYISTVKGGTFSMSLISMSYRQPSTLEESFLLPVNAVGPTNNHVDIGSIVAQPVFGAQSPRYVIVFGDVACPPAKPCVRRSTTAPERYLRGTSKTESKSASPVSFSVIQRGRAESCKGEDLRGRSSHPESPILQLSRGIIRKQDGTPLSQLTEIPGCTLMYTMQQPARIRRSYGRYMT